MVKVEVTPPPVAEFPQAQQARPGWMPEWMPQLPELPPFLRGVAQVAAPAAAPLLGPMALGAWAGRQAARGAMAVERGIGRALGMERGPVSTILAGFQQPAYVAERAAGRAEGIMPVEAEYIHPSAAMRPERGGPSYVESRDLLKRELAALPMQDRQRATRELERITWSGPERQLRALQEMRATGPISQLTPETVTESLKRHENWVLETAGQLIFDPLNIIPVGKITGALKRLAVTKAIKPLSQVSWMQHIGRHAPHIDEATDLASAVDLGLKAPTRIERFIPWGRQPKAKAIKLLDNMTDNVLGWIHNASPEDSVRILRTMEEAPARLVQELGGSPLSLRGQQAHYAVQGFTETATKHLEAWQATGDARRALNAAAQAADKSVYDLILGVGSGEITDAATVKLVTDVGTNATEAGFRADLMADLIDHANAYARTTFDVRGPDWIQRATRKLKTYESAIFLDLNPGYVMRNFFNGEGTMAWDGLHDGFKSLDQLTDVWKSWGFEPRIEKLMPARYKAGLGMAGQRGKPHLLGNVARETERWQSARAFTKGTEQGHRMLIREARAPIPDSLADDLAQIDPDLPRIIGSVLDDVWTPDQALERIKALPGFKEEAANGLGPFSHYISEIAERSGVSEDVLRPVLADIGSHLDDAMVKATTKEDLAEAFQKAMKVLDDGALRRAAMDAEVAEAVEKLRAAGLGPVGLLDSMDELDDLFMNRWVEHGTDLESHWEKIGQLAPDARGAAHERWRVRSGALWDEAMREAQRRRGGIVEAARKELGWEIPDDVVNLYDDLIGFEKSTRTQEAKIIDDFFKRVSKGETPDWATEVLEPRRVLRESLNELKHKTGQEINRLLMEASGVPSADIEKYLNMREWLLRQDRSDVQSFIERVNRLPYEERGEAWRTFWPKRLDNIRENQSYCSNMRRAIGAGVELRGAAAPPTPEEVARGAAEAEELLGPRPGMVPEAAPEVARAAEALTQPWEKGLDLPAERISIKGFRTSAADLEMFDPARSLDTLSDVEKTQIVETIRYFKEKTGYTKPLNLRIEVVDEPQAMMGTGALKLRWIRGETTIPVSPTTVEANTSNTGNLLHELYHQTGERLDEMKVGRWVRDNLPELRGRVAGLTEAAPEVARAAEAAAEVPPAAAVPPVPEAAAPTVEQLESDIWQRTEYLRTMEESKQGFPFGHDTAFKLWDYRTGEVRAQVRHRGKLVPWNYAVDDLATEFGFPDGETFIREVGNFINMESEISKTRKEVEALAKVLQRMQPEDVTAILDDLFQTVRPIHWGDVSLDVTRQVKGWVDDIERLVLADMDKAPPGMIAPPIRRDLVRYVRGLKPDYTDARIGAVAMGEWSRDFALLNYTDRLNYNTWLGTIFPYEFWFTTSLRNWAIRAVDQPARMAAYAKMRRALEEKVNAPGFPARLRGAVRVPIPFMPPWMGGGLFVDPMAALLPIESFREPEETMAWRFRGGVVTGPEGEERPVTPLDVASTIISPHLPLTIASVLIREHFPEGMIRDLLGTRPEEFGYVLPPTRTVQAVSALARPALERAGIEVPPGGWVLEAPVRKLLGLPRNELWDVYRQERMLASMAADETISPDDAMEAMLTHEGDVWNMAVQRAGEELGIARFTSGVLGMRGAVYPIGEQMQRQWTQQLKGIVAEEVERLGANPRQMDYAEQWDFLRYHDATGEGTAVGKFYDTHPAKTARTELFKTPAEREGRRQTEEYWREMEALSADFMRRKGAAPIGAPAVEGLGDWYQEQQAEIKARYPQAQVGLDPGKVYSPQKAAQAELSRLMDIALKGYPFPEAGGDYDEWQREVAQFERTVYQRAMLTWTPAQLKAWAHWLTLEGIEAYQAKRHNPVTAAAYEYRKIYQSPYWAEGRRAEVAALPGEPDWERVDPRISRYASLIDAAADEYDIDPRLIAAIIRVESGGRAGIKNATYPAYGLMQVVSDEKIEGRPAGEDLLDPATNIEWGVKILAGFLKAEDYDFDEGLYRYSGGETWQSRERFRNTYLKNFSSAYKALWGRNLSVDQREAQQGVRGAMPAPTLDELIEAILADPIYEGKWTREELEEALEGTQIVSAMTGYEMRHPEEAREYELRERLNTLLYEQTPPGIYNKALQQLAEVQAARAGGDVRDAIAAISEYMQANPPVGTPAEWAEARRLNDEILRREVDRLFGPEIYAEQDAYYTARDAARAAGQRGPQPTDRLRAYWDFLHGFEAENPVWAKYYRKERAPYQPRGWGRGRGWDRRRRPTWTAVSQSIGPQATQELVSFWRTGASMSSATIQALMALMEEYGIADWAAWLAQLRELFSAEFGAPLFQFRGRPQPTVRRIM